MAAFGEEDQRVLCTDDVTGEELPWSEVRQVREQDLTCLRDLGVYGKVDEREAIAQYQVAPVDTKWVNTKKAPDVEPCAGAP